MNILKSQKQNTKDTQMLLAEIRRLQKENDELKGKVAIPEIRL